MAWYIDLEQGRGGAPSPEVLERLAGALCLTEVEREHLFLLAFGRPAGVRPTAQSGVSARLQRMLDRLDPSPAMVRDATWDVLAWNRACALLFADWGALAPDRRNVLRIMFLDPRARAGTSDWAELAGYVVGAFREESTRAGASERARPLVDELCASSPEFAALWLGHEVRGHVDGVKRIHHPVLGAITLENLVFGVGGRPDLSLVVFEFASIEDEARVRRLMEASMPL